MSTAGKRRYDEESPFRVVLVGLGRMGDMRLEELARRKKHGIPVFENLGALMKEQDAVRFDAVWICVPTPFHMEVILVALENKKHVAVEKPVCSNAEDIRICYETAEAHGVASLVRSGDLGERLVTIHTVFRDYPCPPLDFLKQGGCPFHD
eukprot:g15390.t1